MGSRLDSDPGRAAMLRATAAMANSSMSSRLAQRTLKKCYMSKPKERGTFDVSMERFYCDPESGNIRSVVAIVEAFDFSTDPPTQLASIHPYAIARIASSFRSYLDRTQSLDETFGFAGTGRGTRSAAENYRKSKAQYDANFEFAVARHDDGQTYEKALQAAAKKTHTSPESVKRRIRSK
jgi:hypothetical protein